MDIPLRALQRFVLALGRVPSRARDVASFFGTLYGLLPLFFILPPTLLMGISFPFLQRTTQTDLAFLGRRVGWLQTANIVGSTLGAILTGLVLLHWLGSAWTLRFLIGLGCIFLLLFCRTSWESEALLRRVGYGAALAITSLVVGLSPDPSTLWSKLHGTSADLILFAEDGSGLSLLKDDVGNGPVRTTAFVNGLSQSSLPYGGYHAELGALPVLLHPDPKAVAVIGLGSGNTAFGTGGRAQTQSIDCIEIVAPQLSTLRLLAERHDYPGLRALLSDPRVRYTFTDGRAFIMRGGRYDVIRADALRPSSAYAGNLYSHEYFLLLRRHLKPGGLAVSWGPTGRTLDTFLRAFPYVLVFGATLVGSNEPLAFDAEPVRARMRDSFTRSYYARGGVDIVALLSPVLDAGPIPYGPETDRSRLTDINTDLFPKDEYMASKSFLSPAAFGEKIEGKSLAPSSRRFLSIRNTAVIFAFDDGRQVR